MPDFKKGDKVKLVKRGPISPSYPIGSEATYLGSAMFDMGDGHQQINSSMDCFVKLNSLKEKAMSKELKVGQTVTIRPDLAYGNNGYGEHANSDMVERAGQKVTVKSVNSDGSFKIKEDIWTWTKEMLKSPRTVKEVEVGDFLVNPEGGEARLVIGLDGETIITIDTYDESGDYNFKTIESYEEDGWKIRGEEEFEEETTEVTLEEVAEKLGVDISKLRIKD